MMQCYTKGALSQMLQEIKCSVNQTQGGGLGGFDWAGQTPAGWVWGGKVGVFLGTTPFKMRCMDDGWMDGWTDGRMDGS